MSRRFTTMVVLLGTITHAHTFAADLAGPRQMRAAPFGVVTVYKPTQADPDSVALFVSGDGGWAGLDRELAARLAERGVSTVGFNSLRYFWHARTPEETARDVTRVLELFCPTGRSRTSFSSATLSAPTSPRSSPTACLRSCANSSWP